MMYAIVHGLGGIFLNMFLIVNIPAFLALVIGLVDYKNDPEGSKRTLTFAGLYFVAVLLILIIF